jgi:hypothetical protein
MFIRSAKGIALLLFLTAASLPARAQAPGTADEGPTPPRLSYIDGQASFWRSGAEDWTPARVNMPLATGDRLYTAQSAGVEVQVGARAFVRAADRTEIGFVEIASGFLQIELKDGTAALDLRGMPPNYRVELDTPNAVFTIEHPGYYRVDADGNETHFITRRSGRATVSVEGAPPRLILASEEIVVRGTTDPTVTTYVAPQPDAWDRWNYARTDHEIEALSARYVAPGVYGAGALDQYGRWRVVPEYGQVWVPDRVATGWAPYSAGSWVWDPYYGWTWVDDAPWGWAPFHYGRWVHVGGYWAWAPGPVIVRPVYAPALVAFFGLTSGISVRIGIGGPGVGWVALGWGEPLRPWWGRPGFIGAPWWGGWGGPRVVNNVVIDHRTVVDVNTIVYRHTRVPNAVIAVGEGHFGAGRIRPLRVPAHEPRELEPIREAHPVKPRPSSHAAATGPAVRPPPGVAARPVVTTRPPREGPRPPDQATASGKPPVAVPQPAPRVVTPPKPPDATTPPPRPSFGEKGPERPRPAQPPRYQDLRRPAQPSPAPPAGEPKREPAAPVARPEQRTLPGAARVPAEARPAQPQPATPPVQPPSQRAAPSGATAPREARPTPPQRAVPPAQAPAQRSAPPAAVTPREMRPAQPQGALPGRPANVASPQRAEGARTGAGKAARDR